MTPYAGPIDATYALGAVNPTESPYQIGDPMNPMVPSSVQCPSDLAGTGTVSCQVSMDGDTWVDVAHNNAVVTITLKTSTVIPVPSNIQIACVGWAYQRWVVNTGTTAELVLTLRYAALSVLPSLIAA